LSIAVRSPDQLVNLDTTLQEHCVEGGHRLFSWHRHSIPPDPLSVIHNRLCTGGEKFPPGRPTNQPRPPDAM
jgi:hypothetical protein